MEYKQPHQQLILIFPTINNHISQIQHGTHMALFTIGKVSLVYVCIHSNQAADMSDPFLLKVPVFIVGIICCVFGSNEKPTYTLETSAAESCFVITGHMRYRE